jgi:hypothetical protein
VEITIIVDQPYTRLAILLLKTCVWLVKDDCKFHIVLIFEQKKGTSLGSPHCKDASSLKQSVRGQYVCPSQLYITDIVSGISGNPPTIIVNREW